MEKARRPESKQEAAATTVQRISRGHRTRVAAAEPLRLPNMEETASAAPTPAPPEEGGSGRPAAESESDSRPAQLAWLEDVMRNISNSSKNLLDSLKENEAHNRSTAA